MTEFEFYAKILFNTAVSGTNIPRTQKLLKEFTEKLRVLENHAYDDILVDSIDKIVAGFIRDNSYVGI